VFRSRHCEARDSPANVRGQLLDDGGLIRLDGAEVDALAIPAWAPVGSAPFGQLLLLAADPPGDLVGLLGMDRGQDAGAEQVIEVADVDLAETAAMCQALARSQTSSSSSSSLGCRTSRSCSLTTTALMAPS
jgi:hypothetical protein